MKAQLASYIVFIEFSSGGFFREGECNNEHQEDKKRHRTADKLHKWRLQNCARLKKRKYQVQIEDHKALKRNTHARSIPEKSTTL